MPEELKNVKNVTSKFTNPRLYWCNPFERGSQMEFDPPPGVEFPTWKVGRTSLTQLLNPRWMLHLSVAVKAVRYTVCQLYCLLCVSLNQSHALLWTCCLDVFMHKIRDNTLSSPGIAMTKD